MFKPSRRQEFLPFTNIASGIHTMASQFSNEVGERSSNGGREEKRRREERGAGRRSGGGMKNSRRANERAPCGAGSGAGRAGQGGSAPGDFGP